MRRPDPADDQRSELRRTATSATINNNSTAAVEDRAKRLEAQLRAAERLLEQREDEASTFHAELESANQRFERRDSEARALEAEVKSLNERIMYQDDLTKGEVRALQKALDAAAALNKRQEDELRAAGRLLDQRDAEASTFDAELKAVNERFRSRDKEASALEAVLKPVDEEIGRLDESLRDIKSELDRVGDELGEFRPQLAAANKLLKRLENTLSGAPVPNTFGNNDERTANNDSNNSLSGPGGPETSRSNRELVDRLIGELGARIGIKGMHLDGKDVCGVMFDKTIIVNIAYRAEDDDIVLFSRIGIPSEVNRVALLQHLLEANFFWAQTQGSALALDKDSGTVVLLNRLPAANAELPKLLSMLADFVDTAETWMKKIR